MNRIIKNVLTRIPIVKKIDLLQKKLDQLQKTRDQLQNNLDQLKNNLDQLQKKLSEYEFGWPPGDFYSPIPSLTLVREREDKIWGCISKELPGIALNEEIQLKYLQDLSLNYKLQPWQAHKQEDLRFYFDNPNFSYGEALILSCMMLLVKPKNIIEIGSGYSSCVSIDTNELFFGNSISCTFIEPYPDLLYSLIKKSDFENIKIIPTNLQDIELDTFTQLSAGDILFIDSTHVSKVDSDVNYILFKILPVLQSGVYIHFHDIYFPFEYPKEWVYQGRAWNEAYLLRAFLQYNHEYEIVAFNSFLSRFYPETMFRLMPLCGKNPGSSIWIKKK